MRGRVGLLLASLVLVHAAAGPANGTQPTPQANTFYAHVDENTGDFWFSNALVEPDRWEGGWGLAGPGAGTADMPWIAYDIPLTPAPTDDVHIDTGGKVSLQVAMSRYDAGVSAWQVETRIVVDGALFAEGPAALGTIGVGTATTAVIAWEATPLLDTIPAGAVVEWQIDVGGAATEWYLQMFEGQTQMEWPILDPPTREPESTSTGSTSTSGSSTTGTSTTSASSSASSSSATEAPTPSPEDEPQETPSADAPLPLFLLAAALVTAALLRRR